MSWGLGIWGENRELMDIFRKRMRANPDGILAMIDDMDLPARKLIPGGTSFKKMEIPPEIPDRLKMWYKAREIYVGKYDPPAAWAYSERVLREVKRDFRTLAPLYRLLRGYADEAAGSE